MKNRERTRFAFRRSGALLVLATLAACSTLRLPSVAIPKNEYGLEVVSTAELYRETVRRDPRKEMVELVSIIPGLRIDVRYATADNFMKKVLYPEARVFLRRPAGMALRDAQNDLRAKGLGLKVFDGYRPYSVTKAMWEPIQDPDFVADPAKGSRHNRGCAVDLTLIKLDSGEELAMPTAYDAFLPAAAHTFSELPPEVLANRALLRETMERHGFSAIDSEWWHYDFAGWREYELLDVPFAELAAP